MKHQAIKTDPPSDKGFLQLLLATVIVSILIVVALISLGSCTTTRKAIKHFDAHPAIAADYCMVRYPCKDSVSDRIVYKEGETVTVRDTVTNTETLVSNDTVFTTKTVYRQKETVKHDTVESTRIIYQTDKAAQYALQARYDSCSKSAGNYTTKYKTAAKWSLIGWGLVIGLIAIAIVRLYLKVTDKNRLV